MSKDSWVVRVEDRLEVYFISKRKLEIGFIAVATISNSRLKSFLGCLTRSAIARASAVFSMDALRPLAGDMLRLGK